MIEQTKQPSDSQIIAAIREQDKLDDSVFLELKGEGTKEETFRNGKKVYLYRRTYVQKSASKYKGVDYVYGGGIQFKYSGEEYIFDRFLIGSSKYIGLEPPTKEKIMEMINANMKTFVLPYHYSSITSEITDIKILDEPEWKWKGVKSVELFIEATYTEIISYTETEKAKHTYAVSILRNNFESEWDRVFSREKKALIQSFEKTTYTNEEIKAMKTLNDK